MLHIDIEKFTSKNPWYYAAMFIVMLADAM